MRNLGVILAFLMLAISCSKDSVEALSTDTSTGGSTACFTIMGNYLFTVDVSTLRVYDISSPASPALIGTKYIGVDIETISNNGQYLFIGSQNGFYILNVSSPASPYVVTNYQHIRSCDPVIADNMYAWVTLNTSQTFCGSNVNELQVVNISNISSPYLYRQYAMSSPMGLGKNDTTLFICDGGIKVYDIKNPGNIVQKMYYGNIGARDLIVDDSLLLVIGDGGFSQYRIDGYTLTLLSTINVSN